MPGEDPRDRTAQPCYIQMAAHVHADALVERAGRRVAKLGGQPDFHLRLGQLRLGLARWRRCAGGQQDSSRLQRVEAVDKRGVDALEFRRAVGGGQEAGEAFLNVHAAQTHVGIQQRRQRVRSLK